MHTQANPILDTGVVLTIINEAEQLLNTEPTLLTLSAPVVVCEHDLEGRIMLFVYMM